MSTARFLRGSSLALACALALAASLARAGVVSPDPLADYKKLSLEELMNVEVTSVSRHPEKLRATASAIQVISREDIRRSGATSIPEALRLATNLQVAQVNASQWAISARGFNNVIANKLLVLIDGRSVYTPEFSGVFWDVQDVLLEDVERIEVVSGPGGTLWGANAVNGVINVITRSAAETQGAFAQAGGGTQQALGALRYGGRLGPDLAYRVYGKSFQRDGSVLQRHLGAHPAGSDAHDDWYMSQGGFRVDWERGGNRLGFQGDLYGGAVQPTGAEDVTGGSGLARWNHAIDEDSGVQLQLYFDRTRRKSPSGFTERVDTYDFDGQHHFQLGERQELTWGAGYRLTDDLVANLPALAFLPAHKRLALYSGFAQDQIELIHHRLQLTLGSKVEHNDYTGFEVQPSARLAWTPGARQTVWGAVSRAERTPSRLERGFETRLIVPMVINQVVIQGDEHFESEDLVAYELGWRVQPSDRWSASLAGFYNRYDDLRSAEPTPTGFLALPLTLANGARGKSYGFELSAVYQPTAWWRLRGGYTTVEKHLALKAWSRDANRAVAEYRDPAWQLGVQSSMDLPGGVELNAVLRYVDSLPDQHRTLANADPHVPSDYQLDLSLVWRPTKHLELSISGQNLLGHSQLQFVPDSPEPREIERSVLGKITWRH